MKIDSRPIFESVLPTFFFGNQSTCTYCGDTATSRDHIIPISYVRNVSHEDYRRAYGPMTYACSSCNRHLTNFYFTDFKTRCEYAKDRIERVTKPIIWHNYELNGMDYSLKKYITDDLNRRKWMRGRADWFESRDFLLNIECLLWEPRLDRYSPRFHKIMGEYFWTTLNMLQLLNSISKIGHC